MRYAACKLATKSARRSKELDEFEARDELSLYKMRSSGGGGVKGPFKAGANEVADGGVVLVGAGAGCAVGTTESAGVGSVDTGAGAMVGKALSVEIAVG